MGLIPAFTPEQIISTARSWIGTPYRHRVVKKGRNGGADCVGLVIGVYNELYGESVGKIPEYTPWWAEETGEELMVELMRSHRHSIELGRDELGPGDIFVLRMKYNGPAKHCGFVSFNNQIIHAYSGHAVLETDWPAGWKRRIRYGFRFGKAVE